MVSRQAPKEGGGGQLAKERMQEGAKPRQLRDAVEGLYHSVAEPHSAWTMDACLLCSLKGCEGNVAPHCFSTGLC